MQTNKQTKMEELNTKEIVKNLLGNKAIDFKGEDV